MVVSTRTFSHVCSLVSASIPFLSLALLLVIDLISLELCCFLTAAKPADKSTPELVNVTFWFGQKLFGYISQIEPFSYIFHSWLFSDKDA